MGHSGMSDAPSAVWGETTTPIWPPPWVALMTDPVAESIRGIGPPPRQVTPVAVGI